MGGRGGSGNSRNTGSRSLAWVGRLQSGNEPGMTVAEEYRMKEIEGRYSENDYARAAEYGQTPRQYQAGITEHIRKHGIINPAQHSHGVLDEGYHRYVAARQLKQRKMKIREIG